jgi:hypothetical protein
MTPTETIIPAKENIMSLPQQPQSNPLLGEYYRLSNLNASLVNIIIMQQKHNKSLQERISLLETMPESMLTTFNQSEIILLVVVAALISLCFVV